ncbi:hydrogenase small subunit [Clostridium sp. DJ247]|uniref:hydrogenase small subunit n=1 Tax=Clostridium sp. DJ247 TaxID=2726188 RepID=UPI0016291D8C|nr:hydrogenase small subunit [Clostridium sp. DJ247]MBC2578768.1 hydrogenase small subunit [Clostridium sp. DJ247]
MKGNDYCSILQDKESTALTLVKEAINVISSRQRQKINAIWLEATGCSGNIISLLDATDPDVVYFLKEMVNLTYNNSIMAEDGERAFEEFLRTLETEFILLVDGAVSLKKNGYYNIIAKYQGKEITALEAVKMAGARAKYVLAVGTCASHGGISAASPNPSESVSISKVLQREVINLPGCSCNPAWVIGTLGHIIARGKPELDSLKRPILFYGVTIHDRCQRRSFFDNGIFARKLGEETCMFKLGCRGPVTRTDCPIRQWNGHVNWPIGNDTPCIGCANFSFPDGMEPFVRY